MNTPTFSPYLLIAFFFNLFVWSSLHGQETVAANPLDHFVGTWKVLSKSTDNGAEPEILYYGRAKKMEGGKGIHFVFYKTFEKTLKDPIATVNWAYHPESKMVYGYNPTASGDVYQVEGSIKSNGSLRLKAHKIVKSPKNDAYPVYEWTFQSNNLIHYKASTYKNGNEAEVYLEADVVKINSPISSPEEMLDRAFSLNFAKYLIIFRTGKARGLSAEGVAQEVIDFYSWRSHNWPARPQDLIGSLQRSQAPHRAGYFEVLENSPGQVKFIMGRYWRDWFDHYGPRLGLDEDGLVQGISKDDVETQYRSWLEHYCQKNGKDWKLRIEEQGDLRWIVTISAK